VSYDTKREGIRPCFELYSHPLNLKVGWFVGGDVPQDVRISCYVDAYPDRRFSASFNCFIRNIKPWKRTPTRTSPFVPTPTVLSRLLVLCGGCGHVLFALAPVCVLTGCCRGSPLCRSVEFSVCADFRTVRSVEVINTRNTFVAHLMCVLGSQPFV